MKKIKGKPQHNLRGLTTTIFGAFLSDLDQLEKEGYDEIECNAVKEALNEINENCQLIATSPWMSQIALDYGDWYSAYERWNGPGKKTSNDAIASRRENLLALRKFRSKWKKNVTKNHKSSLRADHDVANFSDKAVKSLEKFCKKYPNYFKNLNGAIEPYFKRTQK